jgi:hypothetical protein
MKKIYVSIAIGLAAISGFAQSNRTSSRPGISAHPLNTASHRVIQNQAPQAAGDTVWIFDGRYSYDWNMTLPGTYSVAVEDVDGLTVSPSFTVFGTTSSYKIFYDTVASATNMHYGHPDTVFWVAATSWFSPAGQADNWIEFGPIHVPVAGGTLSWNHNIPDGSFRDGYEVLVNTTGLSHTNYTNAAVFTVADDDPSTAGDTATTPHYGWYPRQANLNAYAGQDVYIAFHHNAYDEFVLQLTNMILTEGNLSTGIKNNTNGFAIGSNVPNPASNATAISYNLEKNSTVSFSVTDLTGKMMYAENLGNVSAGDHTVNLNTASYTSGMYFYNFVINGNKVTRKFVVAN